MNTYRVYKNNQYIYTTKAPTKKKVLEILQNEIQQIGYISVASVPTNKIIKIDLQNDIIKVEKI